MYVCGVLVAQSCLTFFDPMNCTPPSFSVHGIFHAGTLEWVAFSYSRGTSWPRNRTRISHISCIGRQVLNISTTNPSLLGAQLWCRILFFILTIYLVVLGLSCSTQALQSLWKHMESFSCGSWTLICGMWDLVPWPGIKPWPPALGAWSLSHWTTREVPNIRFLTRQEFKLFWSSASDKINSCDWSSAIV